METIFLITTKKEMFSRRNHIKNKVRKFLNPFFDISFNLIYNIYIYIYIKFSYTITFENLMNDTTSHLMSLICKLSVSKYMIMVRSITNEILKKKKKINKPISLWSSSLWCVCV